MYDGQHKNITQVRKQKKKKNVVNVDVKIFLFRKEY